MYAAEVGIEMDKAAKQRMDSKVGKLMGATMLRVASLPADKLFTSTAVGKVWKLLTLNCAREWTFRWKSRIEAGHRKTVRIRDAGLKQLRRSSKGVLSVSGIMEQVLEEGEVFGERRLFPRRAVEDD